jgi:outer membrane PBP1 activator LpoA protein
MHSFISPILLATILLAMLSACSTTGPVNGGDTGPKPSTTVDSSAAEKPDQRYDIQRDPSERNLAELAELSNSMSGYQPELALEVLRSLESIPSRQLTAMIEGQVEDPEFTEWLELSLLARTTLINGQPVAAAAQHWADYHYGHPVTRQNFPELLAHYQALFPVPAQVAILLPTDGGLAAAGKAIRDGILSAYLEHPGESVIRFYSSGETPESAIAAYLQAREDGAMQIIGPLRVSSTRALSELEDLVVPLLLLNEPSENIIAHSQQDSIVSSLSLSQTEEAAAIAFRALEQGQKRALVLVPESSWGARIEAAFTTEFERGDGQISAVTRFNQSVNDQSEMLTRMLGIDQSKQRKTDLQALLGVPLTFEASRRNDFDFIFLAANPAEGRELKPLLRFHNASDIPVYAMGRVYSGLPDRTSDQDLNDIVFASTPWQLRAARESVAIPASVRGGAFGNLYALGQDSWRLLPWIPLMQKDPDLWYPGDIGPLRMQADGRVYREPTWARFSSGRATPYQWPLDY